MSKFFKAKSPVEKAAAEFKAERGEFYLDLAFQMETQQGTSIASVIATFADRHQGRPLGILAEQWGKNLEKVGGVAEAFRGTVPDEDLLVLSLAENKGDLVEGFKIVGKNVKEFQKSLGIIKKALGGMIGLFIMVHVFLAIQAFYVVPTLEKMVRKSADPYSLGPIAVYIFGVAWLVRHFFILWFIGLGYVGYKIKKEMPQYVGRWREHLDEHFFPFKIYKIFQSSQFFISLGSATRQYGTQQESLRAALDYMFESTPRRLGWIKNKIGMVRSNLIKNPNGKGEIFDVNITSEKIFYRIYDLAEHQEVPVMLANVGEVILEYAPGEIEKITKKINYVMSALLVFVMLSFNLGQSYTIHQFESLVKQKANAP